MFHFVRDDTLDQYCTFSHLRSHFFNPSNFVSNELVQLLPSIRHSLVRKYYEFDESIMREFIGQKLSPDKLRKDYLDGISERIHAPLSCVQRHFDNLCTIMKFVKENTIPLQQQQLSIPSLIQDRFLLSEPLSITYSRMIFICHHRFDTTKRKLKDLSFNDFMHFVSITEREWTVPNKLDLDLTLLNDLKEIRTMLSDREMMEEYRIALVKNLTGRISQEKLSRLSQHKFFIKVLLTIGMELSQPKQLRDFFIDIIEKIGLKLVNNCECSPNDVRIVFDAHIQAFESISDVQKHFSRSWSHHMTVIRSCLLRILDRKSVV